MAQVVWFGGKLFFPSTSCSLLCFLRARSPVSSLGSRSLQVGASEGNNSQAGILQVACCVPSKRALQRAELLLAANNLKWADCMHAACVLILLVPLLCLALFFLEILPTSRVQL